MRRWFVAIAVLIVITCLVFQFVLLPSLVLGDSMYPTLRSGQFVLVLRTGIFYRQIRHGEVVVISMDDAMIVKRVALLPGEVDPDGYRIPEGYVYVLGDNLARSYDSREFGPVPIDRVVGKVIFPRVQKQ